MLELVIAIFFKNKQVLRVGARVANKEYILKGCYNYQTHISFSTIHLLNNSATITMSTMSAYVQFRRLSTITISLMSRFDALSTPSLKMLSQWSPFTTTTQNITMVTIHYYNSEFIEICQFFPPKTLSSHTTFPKILTIAYSQRRHHENNKHINLIGRDEAI